MWAPRAGILVAPASGAGAAVLRFDGLRPLTATTSAAFLRSQARTCAFTVAFSRKGGRAAVGFQFADPVDTYLTPAHTPAAAASYVSLGGAGFCYPAGASVGLRYSEGDKVALALDWASNTLTFTVGARHAAVPIPPQAAFAYPSLSVEGGEVVAEVAAEATPPAPPSSE
jgi:hypothetical protein